jgi:hypothetical protein
METMKNIRNMMVIYHSSEVPRLGIGEYLVMEARTFDIIKDLLPESTKYYCPFPLEPIMGACMHVWTFGNARDLYTSKFGHYYLNVCFWKGKMSNEMIYNHIISYMFMFYV